MPIKLNKNILISTLVLSALAVAGNYVAIPLFYSVSFIFGSIFVIYAAMTLGRCAAVFVAFAGGIYTIYLWGHPYAIIIFILEAFWVASLIKRDTFNVVLYDVLFWLIIGIPAVFIFYIYFIGLPFNAAVLIGLKQTLNGIFNALIASFIFIAINVLWQKKQHVSIRPLLFNIILFMTLIAAAVPIIMSTHQTSNNYEKQINQELKTYAKQIQHALVKHNKINLNSITDSLPLTAEISFTILNKKHQQLLTFGEIKSLSGEKDSEIVTHQKNISIWLPDASLPSMKRWQQGYYVFSQDITNVPGAAKLIVEKSAASVVDKISNLKIEMFSILTALMICAVLFSLLLNRWITQPLNKLDKTSQKLNNKITSGKLETLPQSSISEFSHLSETLNKMALDISDDYQGMSEEKNHLVAIVDKSNEALQRLSMVASRTTNSVVITDTKGIIEWVNDAFTKITGYTIDEAAGKKPGELLQGIDSDPNTISRMSEKLKANESFSEEIINYKKSGERYWIHIDCDPILEDDEFLGFISIESDITQRKNTEYELKNRTSQLNAILNAATEISVISTDTSGLITMFNSGAERMLGYKASDMVNKESPAIFHLESEVMVRAQELSKQLGHDVRGFDVFTALPNLAGSETREWTYIKNDGTHLTVLLSVTPITSDNGELDGYLGVAQDITERKRLDRMKEEFVSTVSHELRTPLTSINGALKLLNGGAVGELSDQVKAMLTIATDNTQRLSLLINDLLDMDKIANGKMDFDLSSHDVMPLVERSISMNNAYAVQHGVSYKIISRCDEAKANIDPNRFLQILANFLSNAAKFSHPGNNVDISVDCTSDKVTVAIKDYGIGISEEFAKKIFNKFSQADSSDTRSKGGTGLGLAISQQLIKQMHGTIGFNSKKGEGSVFWIELPLYK